MARLRSAWATFHASARPSPRSCPRTQYFRSPTRGTRTTGTQSSAGESYTYGWVYWCIELRQLDSPGVLDLGGLTSEIPAALLQISPPSAIAVNIKSIRQSLQSQSIYLKPCPRIESLFSQLQQIPEQWRSYEQRFSRMVAWMDSIDASLANMFKVQIDIRHRYIYLYTYIICIYFIYI